MGSPSHEDYLLRQVRALATLLARMLGLRQTGQLEEARLELEHAYEILLGSQGALVRRLDSSTAAAMLSTPERIRAYAQLLSEEAAQTEDGQAAAALRLHALELALEAAARGGGQAETVRDISELASGVDEGKLGVEHREALQRILHRDPPLPGPNRGPGENSP